MKDNRNNVAGVRCMGCMQEYKERTPKGNAIIVCPHCGYVLDTPAKEVYHLPPGSILQGKYIVGRVLGYGGFGVTYIGYDAQLDRKIAIKEYLPTNFSTRMPGQTKLSIYDGENGEQFRAGLNSFVEEAKRLSKLNSLAGTVDIYDSFLQNDTGYIVMEYLEGKTVKETLAERGVFEYGAAKIIILKILDTLKEVHREGIVHRDIAPDNIFLLSGDDVRLIDFGASRYATTLHTKSLSVILKPGYAPEEQYRSRGEQGSWSDVYALAATFYKMITGITPEESMERMMKDDLKEPSKAGVKLSQNDENAIMNALLVKASDRTQSADEFERQLIAEDDVRRVASTIKKYDAGKIPKWARALASCLGIAAIVFVGLLLSGIINLQSGGFVSALSGEERLARNETRVPNVIGEQVLEAGNIAAEAELLLVISNKEYNDKVEADKVMLQTPLSGRVQLKNSALNVVVSGGAEAAIEKGVMPDVTFRTLEEAIAMMEEAGIKYELVYEESDTIAIDGIISTSVAAGENVGDGVTVIVVVSEGSDKQNKALENAQEVYHVVTFIDWNGTVLSTQNIRNENKAATPKAPERYGYRFVSWDSGFSNVTSDLTVRAVYEKLPEYSVVFMADGSVWDRQTVVEGGSAYRPSDPYKTGYDFGGWTPAYTGLNNVRSNLTFTAAWTPVPTYAVTFKDWNGVILKTETVNRGDSATAPAFPELPRGYGNPVWDRSFTNVRSEITVTAGYSPLPSYTVTFQDWNGTTLKTQTPVYQGESATAPAPNPTRTGYTFSGWSPGFTNVASNLTVTAQYTINTYTVTFQDWNGTVLKSQTVNYGSNATPPSPSPSRTGHTFAGWSPAYTNVAANITCVAQYTINTYTVTFQDWNGTVLKTQTVNYGGSASPPNDPVRSGYRFYAWSPAYNNITANITITAQYVQLQYCYRDKLTVTRSTNDAPAGGTFISSTTNYSAWSGWVVEIDWTSTYPGQPGNTATREYSVNTRTVYQYISWRFWNPWGSPNYFPRDMRGYSGYSYIDGPYRAYLTYLLPVAQQTDMGTMYGLHEGRYWFLETTYGQWERVTRTRSVTGYNVTYWTTWSDWQDAPATASSTREVQTRDKQ